MERTIQKYKHEYKVTTFRAGGYLIEPFCNIRESLKEKQILIDSSVLPGMKSDNKLYFYDFTNYPNKKSYNFSTQLNEIDEKGEFTELPIKTIKIKPYQNLYFKILRKLKYRNLNKDIKGEGFKQNQSDEKNKTFIKLFDLLTKPVIESFTLDRNYKEKLIFMIKKADDYSTMIIHPKLLNNHIFKVLENITENNIIKFTSISEFVKNDRN